MPLSGVNKLCAQCIHVCKQWSQVKVVRCSFFKSKQQKSAKPQEGHTLQAQQNPKEARREAIFINRAKGMS